MRRESQNAKQKNSTHEIKSKRRKQPLANARHIFIFFFASSSSPSYVHIAVCATCRLYGKSICYTLFEMEFLIFIFFCTIAVVVAAVERRMMIILRVSEFYWRCDAYIRHMVRMCMNVFATLISFQNQPTLSSISLNFFFSLSLFFY